MVAPCVCDQVEREARCAAMEADRAANMMEHEKEIMSRPARQWIVSEHRKVRTLAVRFWWPIRTPQKSHLIFI